MVKTLWYLMQGVQIQSLVRELDPICGQKKKKDTTKKVTPAPVRRSHQRFKGFETETRQKMLL